MIGSVENTFESEINHRLKLTDSSWEILFHLSLGSTYLPNNYEELKRDLELKWKKLKPETDKRDDLWTRFIWAVYLLFEKKYGISIVEMKKKLMEEWEKELREREEWELKYKNDLLNQKQSIDYEIIDIKDEIVKQNFIARPKGILAIRVLGMTKMMWPNLFVKNLFSCILKGWYSAKTSYEESLNPTWNETYLLPIFSYEDAIAFCLKAHSTSRANVMFMTEMEERLQLKSILSKSWSKGRTEV